MKFTNQQFAEFTRFMANAVQEAGVTRIQSHRERNLGKDKAKRFRWDLFWLAVHLARDGKIENLQFDITDFYDSHIDTALRKFVADHPELLDPAPAGFHVTLHEELATVVHGNTGISVIPACL